MCDCYLHWNGSGPCTCSCASHIRYRAKEAKRRAAETPVDPAARVLDAMGREWAQATNGSWAALGSTTTADSFAEVDAKYGPCEVLA